MQREILFKDRELLRNVADLALEGTDLRGDVRDRSRQSGLLGARGRDPCLKLAELPAVVACGRGSQNEPGNEDEGQSAGHERRFGGAPDVPARPTGASGACTPFLGLLRG